MTVFIPQERMLSYVIFVYMKGEISKIGEDDDLLDTLGVRGDDVDDFVRKMKKISSKVERSLHIA